MRTRVGILIVMTFLLGILAGPTETFALKNSGTGPTFLDTQVNPKAQGTRVDGTITLYYEPTAEQGTWDRKVFTPFCPAGDTQVRMSWFMRFTQNFINYGFSGNGEPFCFASDLTAQSLAVRNFISSVVIPTLFGPTSQPLVWEIKDITKYTQPAAPINGIPCCRDLLGGGFNGVMEFLTADVAIAVQTR